MHRPLHDAVEDTGLQPAEDAREHVDREDDDEDFIFVKIRDRFPDATFHTAYRLYLNTFNQVKDWEKTLVEIIVRKFEYDLENRKLVSE